MTDPQIVECITGHWSGERAALTISGACPICGMSVTCETDAPAPIVYDADGKPYRSLFIRQREGAPIDDLADEPVIVRSDRGDYDPMADTR